MRITKLKHFTIEMPDDWHCELGESISIYNIYGDGALTLSAYSLVDDSLYSVEERISIMAKHYVQKNRIQIKGSFLLQTEENTTIMGEGKTEDNWYVKIWIIAKAPRVIVATYHSKRAHKKEISTCDAIVTSIRFHDTEFNKI